MAWLTHEDPSTFTPAAQEPDLATLTYWLQRFEPVIRDESDEELIVVFCNRCGMEDDVLYAGTSAVIGIKNGEVSVYGLLGRGSKELLIVNTDAPPFGKLVNRPDAASENTEEHVPQTTPGNTTGNPVSPSQANTNSPYSPVRTHTQSEAAVQAAAFNRHIGGNRRSPAEDRRQPTLNIPTKPSRFVADEEEDCSDSCAEEDYVGCQGNCGGCDEHAYVGRAEAVESPVYPAPTVMAMRPKLPNHKSARALPPITTKRLPSGVKPGNYFTSRDLCTPPITPYDDSPLSAACRAPLPFSPAVNTPVEPDWPVSARTDYHRQPSHAPPSRSASRSTNKSGGRSRNPSRTRGPEVISPITSHHSYQSARTSPTERDSRRARREGEREHECGELGTGRTATRKPAKTGFDDLFSMIPIAASPSVFKTSFSEAEVMNNPHQQQQRTGQPVHMRIRDEPQAQAAPRQRPTFERVPSRLRSTSASNPKIPPTFNYPPPPVPQTPQYTPSSYSSSSRSSSRSRQPSYARRGSEQRTVPSTPSTASPTTPHYYQQHHVLPATTYGGSGYTQQQKPIVHDDEPEAFYGRGPVTPVTPVTPAGGFMGGRDNRGRKVFATQHPPPSRRTHSVDPHRRDAAAPAGNGRNGIGARVNGRYYPPDLLSPVSV